jgi:hypothetical protein
MIWSGGAVFKRETVRSSGNAVLGIVVDSGGRRRDFLALHMNVIVPLMHFGMPFRMIDLKYQRITADILKECAAVVIAERGLSASLSNSECDALIDEVANGMGLVSLDRDIQNHHNKLLELYGFEEIDNELFNVSLLQVIDNRHYICELQAENELHKLDKCIPSVIVKRWQKRVEPLIRGSEETGCFSRPVLFSSRYGSGRIVVFTTGHDLWAKEHYGRLRGLDDIFWRSLIWSTRKPFLANMIPPFLAMSVDDCIGRHDFRYADIAVELGYFPLISFFIDEVPEYLYPVIKEGIKRKNIGYSAHAASYYKILYHHYGQGTLTEEESEESLGYIDNFWERLNTKDGKTVRYHLGEMSKNVLPGLKKRGKMFLCPHHQTGLLKSEMSRDEGFWPYNSVDTYYDFLPDDPYFYIFMSSTERNDADFLTGCTPLLAEKRHVDIDKAVKRAQNQMRHGLKAGFYSEIITHEQKFDALGTTEWWEILKLAETAVAQYGMIKTDHDYIGRYLKIKDTTVIKHCEYKEGRIGLIIEACHEGELKIPVFLNEGEGCKKELRDIKLFPGSQSLEIRI